MKTLLKWLGRAALVLVSIVVLVALLVMATLVYQGRQKPSKTSNYVALGSSYAAGLGLGPRAPGSPLICQRSINGYPQRLAQQLGVSVTDMSCSGGTVKNVLRGGQVFLGPQIDAVGLDTRLVTITAGGNDVSYVGDLTMMGLRHRDGAVASLVRHSWKGLKPIEGRGFKQLKTDLTATLIEIKQRAPRSRIIVATYPTVLPAQGTCARLGLKAQEAAAIRPVAEALAKVTRDAAQAAGATVVDLATLSDGHDACSADPWVNGVAPATGAPFHPTAAGAQATTDAIARTLAAR